MTKTETRRFRLPKPMIARIAKIAAAERRSAHQMTILLLEAALAARRDTK